MAIQTEMLDVEANNTGDPEGNNGPPGDGCDVDQKS